MEIEGKRVLVVARESNFSTGKIMKVAENSAYLIIIIGHIIDKEFAV
jgi:hypothetical protein